ncbi:hypothetical protein [Streptomyces microflavus]|uniref:hypothetical protein n=1 Tax=Streptomyces microflavus TaxID=1919 RepID=UPI0032562100|nr:hypothetical protein OH770_04210 [Streptomyces microflavus]
MRRVVDQPPGEELSAEASDAPTAAVEAARAPCSLLAEQVTLGVSSGSACRVSLLP